MTSSSNYETEAVGPKVADEANLGRKARPHVGHMWVGAAVEVLVAFLTQKLTKNVLIQMRTYTFDTVVFLECNLWSFHIMALDSPLVLKIAENWPYNTTPKALD